MALSSGKCGHVHYTNNVREQWGVEGDLVQRVKCIYRKGRWGSGIHSSCLEGTPLLDLNVALVMK